LVVEDGGGVHYLKRIPIDFAKLESLFVASWGRPKPGYDAVLARSFTWVAALHGDDLVGFVNVAWDGGVHFFLLDASVHPAWTRQGIGRRLIATAIEECRGRGEWLHVDASEELMSGFYRRLGLKPSPAGLIDLTR
jgi:ribosomal protein S18 acetylase RimI-like enzyme